MPFRLRLTVIFFALLLLSAITLPLLIPIPELETVPVRALAGDAGAFEEVRGVQLFYREVGPRAPAAVEDDPTPTLVLLHGFGGSTFSWRRVLNPLGETARVVAFDRPGFGFSARPVVADALNPYTPEAQLELTLGLLDALQIQRAVLVGSSSGSALAVQFALEYPERVAGLVLVSPVLQSTAPPAPLRWLYGTPQAARLGPYVMRQFAEEPGLELLRRSYADPDRLTDADIAGYRRPLRADNWDGALWEVTKASRRSDLRPRLGELDVPTLVVGGADDALLPPEPLGAVAEGIAGAELELLEGCGHVAHEECPEAFLAAVTSWLDALPTTPADD